MIVRQKESFFSVFVTKSKKGSTKISEMKVLLLLKSYNKWMSYPKIRDLILTLK